jgi:raffinose/stachyose/melibiose transport system permease protein
MRGRPYPHWFYLPAFAVFFVFFLLPTFSSFYYGLTRWTLFDSEFIGLDNFERFFQEPALTKGLTNTLIYAVTTSGLKVIFGMLLAVLLTSSVIGRAFMRSVVFFPVLVSTIGVGITFTVLMEPDAGLINEALGTVGIDGPRWLVDTKFALLSVALVDVWKGVGLAMVIYIAGILSIPQELHEAVAVDGGGAWAQFRFVTLPLSRPATFTVIILSFVSGLRTFDLIWTMTNGGPGYTTDVLTSTIFKQYQAGFYGLSTAGNVVLFIMVTALVFPLNWYLRRRELTS